MKNKKNIIYLLLLLIFTILLTSFVTYSWFSLNERSEELLITTGNLKVEAKFYYAIDEDYVGNNPDSYEYIEAAGPINLISAIPGQIYTFKIMIKNQGTIDGLLNINFKDIDVEINMSELTEEEVLNCFILKYYDPTIGENGTVFSRKLSEYDINALKNFELKNSDEYVFYFQIEIDGNQASNESLLSTKINIKSILVQLNQKGYLFN